jgi:hypothetical protein
MPNCLKNSCSLFRLQVLLRNKVGAWCAPTKLSLLQKGSILCTKSALVESSFAANGLSHVCTENWPRKKARGRVSQYRESNSASTPPRRSKNNKAQKQKHDCVLTSEGSSPGGSSTSTSRISLTENQALQQSNANALSQHHHRQTQKRRREEDCIEKKQVRTDWTPAPASRFWEGETSLIDFSSAVDRDYKHNQKKKTLK